MPKYGPVTAEHRERFQDILQHAFALESGPERDEETTDPAGNDGDGDDADEADDEWPPALSSPRGVFDDDGRLVSVCKRYHLDASLHDGYVTIGGLGGVATPPEHRRKGHVRTLAAGALAEYREEGVTIVALWPFSTPFYRHLGWGVANKYTEYKLPPAQLSFARGAAGEVRRLSPDDWERLRAVEVAFGEGTALSLRRSERWWRERTLGAWPGDAAPYVYGYERDGDLRGFVLYTADSDADGRALNVQLLAHADENAFRGLLGFLADHDSQVDTVRLRRAAETELLDRVGDPGAVDCRIESGPMVRLTDVAAGIEAYPWPEGVDVEFSLSVSDPLLDRNDGQFAVAVAGGDATVEAVESSEEGSPVVAVDDSADIAVDVATLSQLVVGSYDAREAQRFGELAVRREPLQDPLADAFPGGAVCLREFF